MTATRVSMTGAPTAHTAWAEPTCWGLTARGLHDRRWAIRGIQVVRRGEGRVAPKGPDIYLLLDPEDLVWFDPAPVVKRLAWIKPRLLRLRVVDTDDERVTERVAQDEAGRLLEIRRQYRPRARAALRPILTPEAGLARAWAESGGTRQETLRTLRDEVGRAGVAVASCQGRIYNAGEREQVEAFLGALVGEWHNPSAVLDGVYEFQPGVWLHETTTVSPGVRLVAPLWLGAGAEAGEGRVLVGPGMAPDRTPGLPVAEVAWDDVKTPAWRLGPRLRGRPGWHFAKRVFDLCFSSGALLATAPLYPVIIALIWLEDGWPPFFAHTRQTVGGREFPCYKFRTMCKDAEKLKAQLAAKNQADGPQFFIDDDPRLLRVGRLLRRFQLDEIPQFWNVLLGHMSVVGPRPSPDKENQYCPAWREARLSVRPGVTGLWQVARTRAPETDFQEWIRYDLEYVQQQSWRLDLWIIWRTILKAVGG